jgi:membrane-bound lytic murein transglycosylase D
MKNKIRSVSLKNRIAFLSFIFLSLFNQTFLKAHTMPDINHDFRYAGGDTLVTRNDQLVPDEAGSALFREKLDSMANSWYIKNLFLNGNKEVDLSLRRNTVLSDSLIVSRLQETESVIKLSYNSIVKDYIETIINRRPVITEIILGLSAFYFPQFEEILDRFELPIELKYLAIIESALNPRAVSRVGAVGLWQFMYGTAKGLNLQVNSLIDERRDVQKSTEAAARYLKNLWDMYHDWHLVIAAYNCGPGNVNKAINRAGGKTDYWKIYFALPRETREFVPAYIATTYIMNYFREHQLTPLYPKISLSTDTVIVHKSLNLKQISDNLNINIEALRDLNPMYKRDIVPGTPEKGYPVRMPADLIASFIEKEDTILNYKRENLFPGNTITQPATETEYYDIGNIEGKTKISYTVKSGDNPGYIADWFDIPVAELKMWNHISRNMIRAGQKLVIFVPNEKVEYYKKINNLSFIAKQELSGYKAEPVTSAVSAGSGAVAAVQATNDDNYIYHTVQKGENFWTIAKQYPGVTNTDILQLNNITDERSLRAGQKLKIKPKT